METLSFVLIALNGIVSVGIMVLLLLILRSEQSDREYEKFMKKRSESLPCLKLYDGAVAEERQSGSDRAMDAPKGA